MTSLDYSSLGNCQSTQIIQELETRLNDNETLSSLLLESLHIAQSEGCKGLEKNLFERLEWPTTVVEYLSYLIHFAKWIPRPYHTIEAWKANHPPTHDQAYDKMCHFHFLIAHGSVLQDEWFVNWHTRYSRAWGTFLNTPESFSQEILEEFLLNAPLYEVRDSMISDDGGVTLRSNNPSGWLTFNQFFARTLNPGLRPITSRVDNHIVCSPADCTFREMFSIDEESKIPQITIKNTHRFGSIPELLMGHDELSQGLGEPFATAFAGGKFVHYFLGPYSYHRFHSPVSGMVKACYHIHGRTYLDVGVKNQQFDAPDSAADGYEFRQARGVLILDTSNSEEGDIGLVAVVPIGMTHVSSVNMSAQTGYNLHKGDEFGYFLFGGSDIILLFQQNRVQHIDDDAVYHRYGQRVASMLNASGH
jgi:phosphatidylserine decarboxylase